MLVRFPSDQAAVVGRRHECAAAACMVILSLFSAAAAKTSDHGLVLETRTLNVGDRTIMAEFGAVELPAVRNARDAGLVTMKFVRLKSATAADEPPIFYLAGGPGNSGTAAADNPLSLARWAPMLRFGDVVLIDQRGAGKSEPNMLYVWHGDIAEDFFISHASALAHRKTIDRAAIKAFEEKGVALDAFTTEEAADDVNALRKALGYDDIVLFGFSYGTHLALSVVRRHGEHVAKAVLVGVEGPDHTYKLPLEMDRQFEKIAEMAANDPMVSKDVPDLVALLDRVNEQLARAPMPVDLQLPSGETVAMPIGPYGLHLLLRHDIGDASDIPVFPKLLHSISQGDPRLLQWFAQKRAFWLFLTHGMSVMTDAASGASQRRMSKIKRQRSESKFGPASNFPFPEIVEVWDPPALDKDFRTPVRSDIPALLLSGSLDWNAPPHQAEEIVRGFSNAVHIIVENAGHEQILKHPETAKAIFNFLAGEDVSGISPSYPPLQFVPVDPEADGPTHPAVPR